MDVMPCSPVEVHVLEECTDSVFKFEDSVKHVTSKKQAANIR
jgi:hypothetical protein